jgi:thioredoxin reductase (NADPH)
MKTINSSEFDAEVLHSGKVVLDFYSTECPPCEALASKFEDLSLLYGKDVKFLKIFRQGNRELADKLGVKSSPSLLFFDNGKEVGERLTGGIKRIDIIRNLDNLLPSDKVNSIKSKIKPSVSEFDVIILGAGPGGLTAGLYLCQSKINTVLIDIALPGGNVATTHSVSNYPGFIEPQAGYMLSHNMSEQTKLCGTIYKVAVDITRVDLDKKEVIIDEYETVKAKKIIIATGTTPNLTGAPGEKELKGKGISYCATCDAKYFDGKEAIVIGGGNSAIEESEYITRFASKLTIVHQFDKFTANKQAQDKVLNNPKISILFENEPRSFTRDGDKIVTEIENVKTKVRHKLELDKWGYIKTNEDMKTSVDGIYAVGDVISKKYRQITTAVADGTIAAMAIAKELD